MHQSVVRDKQKIDSLYGRISLVDELEMQAHWSKYLCVLTSGFIENSIRTIIGDYALNKSSPAIANFVQGKVKQITNLKNANIISLLNTFDQTWGTKYKDNITEEQIASIDSVVANRHLIAHGKNVGITYVAMSNYYGNVVPAVELIYKIVNDKI